MKKEQVIIQVTYVQNENGEWGYKTLIEGTAEQVANSMIVLKKDFDGDEELNKAIKQYLFEKSLKTLIEKLHKSETEGNDATETN